MTISQYTLWDRTRMWEMCRAEASAARVDADPEAIEKAIWRALAQELGSRIDQGWIQPTARGGRWDDSAKAWVYPE